jgi:hypothetical protein
LVDVENAYSVLNKSTTITKYRYDDNFTIKQIEKNYPDNRVVYWEAFFTPKGIIQKEFYTLKEERYIFLYNENGQEISGEIRDLVNDKVKKEWTTSYTTNGKMQKREESNYVLGKKILTWYNSSNKETKIETYSGSRLDSIESFQYNDKNKVILYEIIIGLVSNKEFYDYDKSDKIIKITYYENEVLKKIVDNNEDGTRTETLISGKNSRVIIQYDKDGKKVSEELF